jgi:hypothetical protein
VEPAVVAPAVWRRGGVASVVPRLKSFNINTTLSKEKSRN